MRNSNDEKLREKIGLLKRLYWLDEIYKIGIELNIQSIQNIQNYWELNHDDVARQIAERLDDHELLNLISRHIPKYVSLGGFQGQFYSVDENKHLTLASSWETVKKNVNKSLDKWNQNAYGVLQALINKNGKSSFVELINEIENVLGRDYTPSFLLPRLESLRLVFKSGSNKYPYWIIPEEIVSVVKDELKKYSLEIIPQSKKIKTNPQRISRKRESELLTRELKLDNIVEDFVNVKSDINLIFQHKFKIKFFRDNEKAVILIRKPSSNEDDFMYRIQWLSAILTDDVEITDIKKLLKNSDNMQGSFDFMEIFLNQHDVKYDKNIIQNLRMLKILRNKKYPAHPDDGIFLEAVKFFGQPTFPPDWTVLWESVLKSVTESLVSFRNYLQQINAQ